MMVGKEYLDVAELAGFKIAVNGLSIQIFILWAKSASMRKAATIWEYKFSISCNLGNPLYD